MENIVLRDLDEWKFSENISESLREDNISESCYTNFKDILVEIIIQMISEIVEKDGWETQYFEEEESEKLFEAFMKNSEITVRLNKKVDKSKYVFEKAIVKFDFSEDEKKKIAEVYIDNILEGYYYLDLCLFTCDDEDDNDEDNEINVDTTAKILSNEVYHLLSPEEIKAKFKDKIEEAIKVINDAENYDDDE